MSRTAVFQHPVPGSRVLPGPTGGDQIVLSVDRPGYGRAPRLDSGTVPTIAGIAERTLDQVRTSGVDHIDHVVGWSGGGHYALAMAALAPERIDAVTLIATPAHDDDVPWIPDHLRPLTEDLRRDPGTAVDQLVDHIGDLRADLSMLCAGEDTTLLDREPEWRQRLERMLDTAFDLGTTGMATDIVAQHVTDWSFNPADVQQPVQLVYAAQDPLVPLTHGRHWQAALPDAHLSVVARAGHVGPLHHFWTETFETCAT